VSIFNNVLPAAFICTDPKSVKIRSSCQYLFALLGSAHTKALCTMLMKLTPGQKSSSGIHHLVRGQRRDPERRVQPVVGGRGQVLELPGVNFTNIF